MELIASGHLNIVRSHPRLTWLVRPDAARAVPSAVVAQLDRLTDLPLAKAWLADLGLPARPDINRFSRTTFAVSLQQPPELDEYNAVQVLLPRKLELVDVPPGSVLVNCLVPTTADAAEGEKAFNYYKATVERIAAGLQALPFACMTGFKTRTPANDLASRGFRFFFSSQPDVLFERIEQMLVVQAKYFALAETFDKTNEAHRDSLITLSGEIQRLKFASTSDNSLIGHSLLEDIKPLETDPQLVDLR